MSEEKGDGLNVADFANNANKEATERENGSKNDLKIYKGNPNDIAKANEQSKRGLAKKFHRKLITGAIVAGIAIGGGVVAWNREQAKKVANQAFESAEISKDQINESQSKAEELEQAIQKALSDENTGKEELEKLCRDYKIAVKDAAWNLVGSQAFKEEDRETFGIYRYETDMGSSEPIKVDYTVEIEEDIINKDTNGINEININGTAITSAVDGYIKVDKALKTTDESKYREALENAIDSNALLKVYENRYVVDEKGRITEISLEEMKKYGLEIKYDNSYDNLKENKTRDGDDEIEI